MILDKIIGSSQSIKVVILIPYLAFYGKSLTISVSHLCCFLVRSGQIIINKEVTALRGLELAHDGEYPIHPHCHLVVPRRRTCFYTYFLEKFSHHKCNIIPFPSELAIC